MIIERGTGLLLLALGPTLTVVGLKHGDGYFLAQSGMVCLGLGAAILATYWP